MSILFTIIIFIILSEYFITKDLTYGYKARLYSKIPSKKMSMQDIMTSSTEPSMSKRKKRNYGQGVNPTTDEYRKYINDMFEETKKGVVGTENDKKLHVSDEARKKIDDLSKNL